MQGLPTSAIACAWSRALSSEKQQKITLLTTGAEASAPDVAETAIWAARPAGKP
jgi:hypothetical protein